MKSSKWPRQNGMKGIIQVLRVCPGSFCTPGTDASSINLVDADRTWCGRTTWSKVISWFRQEWMVTASGRLSTWPKIVAATGLVQSASD